MNTPPNLNHAVRDGGLGAGTNSLPFPRTRMSDADEGGTRMPKKREGERSRLIVLEWAAHCAERRSRYIFLPLFNVMMGPDI